MINPAFAIAFGITFLYLITRAEGPASQGGGDGEEDQGDRRASAHIVGEPDTWEA